MAQWKRVNRTESNSVTKQVEKVLSLLEEALAGEKEKLKEMKRGSNVHR